MVAKAFPLAVVDLDRSHREGAIHPSIVANWLSYSTVVTDYGNGRTCCATAQCVQDQK